MGGGVVVAGNWPVDKIPDDKDFWGFRFFSSKCLVSSFLSLFFFCKI